jgi:hypothetical protein
MGIGSRPAVDSCGPQREAKLQALHQPLSKLPANEIAAFQDEVEINTKWSPKVKYLCVDS